MKRSQKIGQGPPSPLFGQDQKEEQFLLVRPSLMIAWFQVMLNLYIDVPTSIIECFFPHKKFWRVMVVFLNPWIITVDEFVRTYFCPLSILLIMKLRRHFEMLESFLQRSSELNSKWCQKVYVLYFAILGVKTFLVSFGTERRSKLLHHHNFLVKGLGVHHLWPLKVVSNLHLKKYRHFRPLIFSGSGVRTQNSTTCTKKDGMMQQNWYSWHVK